MSSPNIWSAAAKNKEAHNFKHPAIFRHCNLQVRFAMGDLNHTSQDGFIVGNEMPAR